MFRSQITVQLQATPENRAALDAMRAWSRRIPTLYFLDNSVVSRIRKAISNGSTVTRSFADVDLPHNGVSYMPTLMEKASNQTNPFTENALIAEIQKDLRGLRAFFNQAKVLEPEEFAIDYAKGLRGSHPETLGPEYHQLLTIANETRLYDPISDSKRFSVAKAICSRANELHISPQHPILLAILGCIYDCIPAKHVIKFTPDSTKFNSSGALADIQLIQRIGRLSLITSEPDSKFVRTELITDDRNLEKLYSLFFVNEVTNQGDVADKVRVTVNVKGLFPSLHNPDGSLKSDACLQELIDIHALLEVGSTQPACD